MLPIGVKELIENRYGQKVRYPRDCEGLSADILVKTNDRISTSTLKRLFGFVKAQNYPNQHTLDVIAVYLGYSDWKEVPGSQIESQNVINRTNSAEHVTYKTNQRTRKLFFVFVLIGLLAVGFLVVYTTLNRATVGEVPNNFTILPDLPEVRSGGRIVFHDHHIYFLGGSDAEFMRDNNWRYDTITKAWTAMKPIPTPRAEIGCAIQNHTIYCFGGWRGNDSGATNIAEAYDILTDSWETLPNLPYAITSAYAVTLDDAIYILGGTIGETKNYFFRYNILTQTYDTLANYEVERNLAVLTIFRNRIFAIGGQSFTHGEYKFHNNVDVYNIEENEWEIKPPLPMPLSRFGVTGQSDKLYVIGGTDKVGEDTSGLKNDVLVYSDSLKNWRTEGNIPYKTCGLSTIILNDRIFLLGGNRSFPNPDKRVLSIPIPM